MTRLAIISDLHFGTVPDGLAADLAAALRRAAPDLVVIAGDLTQRARAHQFAAARAWLDDLALPWLVVPGNHDIPLHNPVERFHRPFHRYRQAINEILSPIEVMADTVVAGLNTVRSWQPHYRWQEGAVRSKSLRIVRTALEGHPRSADQAGLRMVVSHHPLHRVPGNDRARVARNGARAGAVLSRLGTNILVSGHTHRSFAMPVRFAGGNDHLLSIGAPTAMSDRTRGEANGFWLIDQASKPTVRCALLSHDGAAYIEGRAVTWRIGAGSVTPGVDLPVAGGE